MEDVLITGSVPNQQLNKEVCAPIVSRNIRTVLNVTHKLLANNVPPASNDPHAPLVNSGLLVNREPQLNNVLNRCHHHFFHHQKR
jgi:hypothetical protein